MITMAEFSRVQSFIKGHGVPRPITHEFAYGFGTCKCAECGYSIVGIEKIKYIKSEALTKVYVLYLCGNKGKVTTCGQNFNINEVELEKQIKEEISKYSIDPEFLHWALEVMKDNKVIEMVTEKDVKESVARTLEIKQEELKKLIQMAMKGFISDEEFKESRAGLDNIIAELKDQMAVVEKDQNKDLMELTEKAFSYSTYALVALQNGDKQTRKEIFKSLGMNRTIKDKILNVRANEWFVEVRNGYTELRKILARDEPGLSYKQTIVSDFPNIRSVLRG